MCAMQFTTEGEINWTLKSDFTFYSIKTWILFSIEKWIESNKWEVLIIRKSFYYVITASPMLTKCYIWNSILSSVLLNTPQHWRHTTHTIQ